MAKCGSTNTYDGQPCQNPKDTCPHNHTGKSVKPRAVAAPVPSIHLQQPLESLPSSESEKGKAYRLGLDQHAIGLAGSSTEFLELINQVRQEINVEAYDLARDYWLTSCLHSLFITAGRNGVIHSGQGKKQRSSAVITFAGGTSLVSAWDIAKRYSEDLDVMALMLDPQASSSARKRPLSLVTKWASQGLTNPNATKVEHMGDVGHRITHFKVGDNPNFLKMETTVETGGIHLCERRPVMSIMGRFATPEQLQQYPELGGFDFPAIVPEYTAANKFDALHRRAVTNNLKGISNRGRDLYDLAMIAHSDRADIVRETIPELSVQASMSAGRRRTVMRPPKGYASSILFRQGSESQEALRDGYEIATYTVWGHIPKFEDALDLAASLDAP